MENAYSNERRRLIFFLDSRGTDLEREINLINTDNKLVEPWTFKGATIEDLTHEAINYGHLRPFDVMFVAGGICNITTKDWKTGKITFEWVDPVALRCHIVEIMETQERKFKKNLPASNLIFCDMVGANLEKVLGHHAENEQYVLDEAIYKINDHIFRCNIEKGLWAPDMASPVHRMINGQYKSFYNHLASDGIHLSQELKKKWAKKLLKTVDKY